MESHVTKVELLRRLEAGQAQFEAVLARLTPTQIEHLEVGDGWTVKDLLAHFIAHEQRALEELRMALRDEPADIPLLDNDAFNLGAIFACRSQSFEQIRAAWNESFREVISAVQALTEADFDPSGSLVQRLGDTIDGAFANNSYEHYAAHRQELEAAIRDLTG
jgi:hypothetical protein